MPTLEDENNLRDQLHGKLSEVLSNTSDSLIQEDRLGIELSFKSGVPYFNRAFSLLSTLNDADISRIPYSHLDKLIRTVTEVDNLINQIKSFTAAATNTPINTRDGYIASFRDNYASWFDTISPIIAFCIREGTDFQAIQDRAKDILINLNALQDDSNKKSVELINSTEATLEKVRRAAAEVGVSQHATHFQEEAKSYETNSRNWLIATGIFAFATAAWGFGAFYCIGISPDEINNHYVLFVQAMIARGSVLIVLLMTLIWSSKNYAASRHNYIINKQRQNSLSTFETFVKAAGDEDIQTKNAVLLQATQCIFSAQPTGFSNKGSESDPSTKIIEIAKDFSKLGK